MSPLGEMSRLDLIRYEAAVDHGLPLAHGMGAVIEVFRIQGRTWPGRLSQHLSGALGSSGRALRGWLRAMTSCARGSHAEAPA